jgi:hypothetical protein
MSTPSIHTFALGEYQTNCFVVNVPPSKDCWIVDCGYSPGELQACCPYAVFEDLSDTDRVLRSILD